VLVDFAGGLGGADFAGFNFQLVGNAFTPPTREVEEIAGSDLLDSKVAEGQRPSFFDCSGCMLCVDEVCVSEANDLRPASGFEQDGRALFYPDSPDSRRGSGFFLRLVETSQEYEQPSHAVPAREVCVGDDSLEDRNLEESLCQGYARTQRICQSCLSVEVRIVRLVSLGGVDVLAHNCEARTCSAYGDAATDRVIHRGLDWRSHPKVDVTGLIASRDEDCARVADFLFDKWIECGGSVWNHNGGNGIQSAETLNVAVIVTSARGPNDQEVASAGSNTKPAKCLVEVLASAHKRKAGARRGRDIFFIPDAKVLV